MEEECLLSPWHCTKCLYILTHFYPHNNPIIDFIIILILRKLRHTGVTYVAQGHRAGGRRGIVTPAV